MCCPLNGGAADGKAVETEAEKMKDGDSWYVMAKHSKLSPAISWEAKTK